VALPGRQRVILTHRLRRRRPCPPSALNLRRLASTLLLVLGLTAAGGFAADERRYEACCCPTTSRAVSVSIELRKLQGLLVGEFKAESPSRATAASPRAT
jgi:hypothetical protein